MSLCGFCGDTAKNLVIVVVVDDVIIDWTGCWQCHWNKLILACIFNHLDTTFSVHTIIIMDIVYALCDCRDGLIAVNYPARSRGVTRHMRAQEALKMVPDICLVHVDTIGDAAVVEGSSYRRFNASEAPLSRPTSEKETSTASHGSLGGQGRADLKVSLETYRRESVKIMALIRRCIPCAVIEKASIDEFYIDVTELVEKNMTLEERHVDPSTVFSWGSIVVEKLDPGSEFDRRLALGAEISCRVRGAIMRDLKYTSSAGIASNKLLAKLGSAMHKPNQQTIIPPNAVEHLMSTLPLRRLKGFGGNLGKTLETMGCSTAGDVSRMPLDALIRSFGAERARWIAAAVRGLSEDPVEEKERPKSLLAAKSFEPTSDLDSLYRWLSILAAELASRMDADRALFRRVPKTMALHFRRRDDSDRSRQIPFVRKHAGSEASTHEAMLQLAWDLFQKRCAPVALPCCRLALSVCDFQDERPWSSSIARFFQNKGREGASGETSAAKGDLHCDEAPILGDDNKIALGSEVNRAVFHVGVGVNGCIDINGDPVEDVHPRVPLSDRAGASSPLSEGTRDERKRKVDETEDGLDGIDVEEQRRLMKEVKMLNAFKNASTSSNRGGFKNPKTNKTRSQRQGSIRSFFPS